MRGMNGSTGASPDNRGYPGGIPTSAAPPLGLGMGMGPGGPGGMGGYSQAAAAAAAAAGLGGPELKHHADFLSRLLAATPSYMSEMGNPPPGFFSDWLRRLVSKPSGNASQSSSGGMTFPGPGGGQAEGERPSGTPTTPSMDAQLSTKRRKRSRLNDHSEHPLGGSSASSGGSEPERPGSGSTGHPHTHHPLPPSSSATSLHHGGGPMTSSASSPPSSASGGFPSLGGYPFWFFPPFLPNPYGLGMNLGMNFPGHPGMPPGAPGLSAAAQAAALSSYLGGASPSDLFRTDNLNLLSGSITASGAGGRMGSANSPHALPHPFPPPPQPMDGNHHLGHPGHPHLAKLSGQGKERGKDSSPVPRSPVKDSPSFLAAAAAAASASFLMGGTGGTATAGNLSKLNNQLPSPSHYGSNNHNGVHGKMTAKSPPGKDNVGTKGNNNKSSFSISRLTSPSPSSNSSGGSCSGSNSKFHGGQGNRAGHHRSSSSSYEDIKPHGPQHQLPSYKSEESVLKSNLNSGTKMPKDSTTSSNQNSSSDAGLCVDLRVSGRIWEQSSGVPPPRSIYTPLSAFRDPAENLYNSSQVPRYDPHHHQTTNADHFSNQPMPTLPPTYPATMGLLQQKTPPMSGYPKPPTPTTNAHLNATSDKHLSTKYVLRNIQHIYHRIRPTPSSSPAPTKSNAGSPNPNQITTSHPINNHSPPATKPTSPTTGQTAINHHHSLHSDNKNNSFHNKSKKTNRDSGSRDSPPTNANNTTTTTTPADSENEDNNVIIPRDSRPHSSSSSLDDDDFQPEADLKTTITDNTLNLTLNNNVEKGKTVEKSESSNSVTGDILDRGSSTKTHGEKKVRKKSIDVGSEQRGKKRKANEKEKHKDSFEGKTSVLDVENENDNPYNFVDNDDHFSPPVTPTPITTSSTTTSSSSNTPKSKSKKIKKENNNESEDEGLGFQSSNKKFKISIPKVQSESRTNCGDDEDEEEEGGDEDNEVVKIISPPTPGKKKEEEAQEC